MSTAPRPQTSPSISSPPKGSWAHPSAETGTDEQRLAALRDRLQQIQRRFREVEQEIRELTNSPTMQMNLDVRFAQWQGRDLLAEMAADVEKDLARKRVELDFLVAQLKQLGIAG